MAKVTLFHLERPDIKIDIEARFEGQVLVIDGYDIGTTVEEYWHDSDYEYNTKVPAEGVEKLYLHFGFEGADQEKLLKLIAERYNTNTCYSEFQKLLEDLGIRYFGFSWM